MVPEQPLQRQIADALRLEIAPPGKVSGHGVVRWSVDHASYAGTAPGALASGVPLSRVCRTCSCCRQQLAIRQSQECIPIVFKRSGLAHAHLLVGA